MPTVKRFDRCRIEMYFDDHPPPYFHVVTRKNQRIAVVIETLVIQAGDTDSRDTTETFTWARANRGVLRSRALAAGEAAQRRARAVSMRFWLAMRHLRTQLPDADGELSLALRRRCELDHVAGRAAHVCERQAALDDQRIKHRRITAAVAALTQRAFARSRPEPLQREQNVALAMSSRWHSAAAQAVAAWAKVGNRTSAVWK